MAVVGLPPSPLPATKAVSTRRFSRAVPHRGTNRAFRRLTSEFRWDRVFSTKYGRRRSLDAPCGCSSASGEAKLVAPNRCEKDTTFSRDLCFRAIFTSPGTMPCISTKKCDQKKRDEDSAWCWCLNRWDEKEGCAERIARVGTLSQNGYGENINASKRAKPDSMNSNRFPETSRLGNQVIFAGVISSDPAASRDRRQASRCRRVRTYNAAK